MDGRPDDAPLLVMCSVHNAGNSWMLWTYLINTHLPNMALLPHLAVAKLLALR